jgi:hypothetical protein
MAKAKAQEPHLKVLQLTLQNAYVPTRLKVLQLTLQNTYVPTKGLLQIHINPLQQAAQSLYNVMQGGSPACLWADDSCFTDDEPPVGGTLAIVSSHVQYGNVVWGPV